VSNFTGVQNWVNTALPISFVTYCVEFNQNFTLPMSTPIDYDLVAGSAYSHWGADAATIANRLGSLLTHVNGLANPVDTYKESAAVQLAIWETIYEKPVGVDLDLNNGNLTETRGGAINAEIRTLANGYLNGTDYTRSIYDVFVLSNATRQDFIALREGGGFQQNVPEPGALALSLAALGALGVASRRRRAG
jgi:hypothetical protein